MGTFLVLLGTFAAGSVAGICLWGRDEIKIEIAPKVQPEPLDTPVYEADDDEL
jgi:hypothetical protein